MTECDGVNWLEHPDDLKDDQLEHDTGESECDGKEHLHHTVVNLQHSRLQFFICLFISNKTPNNRKAFIFIN